MDIHGTFGRWSQSYHGVLAIRPLLTELLAAQSHSVATSLLRRCNLWEINMCTQISTPESQCKVINYWRLHTDPGILSLIVMAHARRTVCWSTTCIQNILYAQPVTEIYTEIWNYHLEQGNYRWTRLSIAIVRTFGVRSKYLPSIDYVTSAK